MTDAYSLGFASKLAQLVGETGPFSNKMVKKADESYGMNASNNIVQRASSAPGPSKTPLDYDLLFPPVDESKVYPRSIELGKRIAETAESDGGENPFTGFSNPELSAYGYNLDANTGIDSDLPNVNNQSSWDMQTSEWLRDPRYVNAFARALTPEGTNLLEYVADKQKKPARLDKVDSSLGKGTDTMLPWGFIRTQGEAEQATGERKYNALQRLLSGMWRVLST